MDLASQAARALVLYALAEYQAGHATMIDVRVSGRTFEVTDNGLGHSVAKLVAGSPYLRFVYTHLDYPFGPKRADPCNCKALACPC